MAIGMMQSLSCKTGYTAGGQKKGQGSLRGVGQIQGGKSKVAHSDPLKVRCSKDAAKGDTRQSRGANDAGGVPSPCEGFAHGLRIAVWQVVRG